MKALIALGLLIGTGGTALAQTAAAPADAPAPAPMTLGEGHARALMMNYGCSNVSQLSRGKNGWFGQCSKGGRTIDVQVKPDGTVGPAADMDRITEGHARAALMNFGCSNVSTLSHGAQGSWHGNCTKGGTTQFVSVDPEGKVTTGAPTSITEAHARSSLMQFGCNNLSTLHELNDGDWAGQCSKGGRTVDVVVDKTGAAKQR